MNIVIIDYGAGNIKSLEFALNRLGYTPKISKIPSEIVQADKIIFPGVGHARMAMEKLKENGLDTIIPQLEQPVLGICLGMQLLCNYTEEGDTIGMGVFNSDVVRFSPSYGKVPHMGWNTISDIKTSLFESIREGEHMYLVHSYYIPKNEHTIATSNYGLEYSSALQMKNFYGVQFHPEKSGVAGAQLLQNFLNI